MQFNLCYTLTVITQMTIRNWPTAFEALFYAKLLSIYPALQDNIGIANIIVHTNA